jgi:hypothetical protein
VSPNLPHRIITRLPIRKTRFKKLRLKLEFASITWRNHQIFIQDLSIAAPIFEYFHTAFFHSDTSIFFFDFLNLNLFLLSGILNAQLVLLIIRHQVRLPAYLRLGLELSQRSLRQITIAFLMLPCYLRLFCDFLLLVRIRLVLLYHIRFTLTHYFCLLLKWINSTLCFGCHSLI